MMRGYDTRLFPSPPVWEGKQEILKRHPTRKRNPWVLFQSKDSPLQSGGHRQRAVVHSQLAENVFDKPFHGTVTDGKRRRDLPVTFAFCNQAQYLHLA